MQSENSENILSAYEKAGEDGIDSRCIPQRIDGNVPIGEMIQYPDYPDTDHQIWEYLYKRQMQFLPGRACDEFLNGLETLKFIPEKIPSLKFLSSIFKEITGWQVARVPGLIHEQDFFQLLQKRIFPSTDYIRTKEELDYTPAPDLFHDIFGHMPLLTNKSFASFYQKFGEAALNAKGKDRKYLETFHWFTVEFGLINTNAGRRIYGAGVLSSLNEVQHALSEKVRVEPFNPEKMVNQDYDVWHIQPVLYAIESFEELEEGFNDWTKRRNLL